MCHQYVRLNHGPRYDLSRLSGARGTFLALVNEPLPVHAPLKGSHGDSCPPPTPPPTPHTHDFLRMQEFLPRWDHGACAMPTWSLWRYRFPGFACLQWTMQAWQVWAGIWSVESRLLRTLLSGVRGPKKPVVSAKGRTLHAPRVCAGDYVCLRYWLGILIALVCDAASSRLGPWWCI